MSIAYPQNGFIGAPAIGRHDESRLRLTRRGRAVRSGLIAVLLSVVLALAAVNVGGAVASGDDTGVGFSYVEVVGGQTLWGIAESIAPTANLGDVVAEIMILNRLGSADIVPAQRIAIPTKYAPPPAPAD